METGKVLGMTGVRMIKGLENGTVLHINDGRNFDIRFRSSP